MLLVLLDVFKTSRHLGNFAAILLTYAASAMLHVSIDCSVQVGTQPLI